MQGGKLSCMTNYIKSSNQNTLICTKHQFQYKPTLTRFLLKSLQGRSVTAGAVYIPPYSLFSSTCLLVIFLRISQSLNRVDPGIPPFKWYTNINCYMNYIVQTIYQRKYQQQINILVSKIINWGKHSHILRKKKCCINPICVWVLSCRGVSKL